MGRMTDTGRKAENADTGTGAGAGAGPLPPSREARHRTHRWAALPLLTLVVAAAAMAGLLLAYALILAL